MSKRLSRKSVIFGFLCSALSATPCLAAQSFLPMVNSGGNAADFSTTIAQGSSFVVVGSSLGPATPVTASSFPLLNTLSGTSVTVTSGSAKLNCPLTYTSQDEVRAILPSNTPIGLANITVAYNGQTGPGGSSTFTVTVVATSVGVFTTTGTGRGAGNFTASGTPVTFANSAVPSGIVTAQATGLGPIGTPDNELPTAFPNFPNVQVWVGSQLAQLVSDARSASSAGIDQISFAVPTGIAGCNVPVTVVSGGNLSNTVTLPVSAAGGACIDSGPTPPTSVLTKATAGQPVKVAVIGMGPTRNRQRRGRASRCRTPFRRASHPGFRSGRGEIDACLCVAEPAGDGDCHGEVCTPVESSQRESQSKHFRAVGSDAGGRGGAIRDLYQRRFRGYDCRRAISPCRSLCHRSAKPSPASGI